MESIWQDGEYGMKDSTLVRVVWLGIITISATSWYYIIKLIKYLWNLIIGE